MDYDDDHDDDDDHSRLCSVMPGYVFAAAGLILGGISNFWTWGFTGKAKEAVRLDYTLA